MFFCFVFGNYIVFTTVAKIWIQQIGKHLTTQILGQQIILIQKKLENVKKQVVWNFFPSHSLFPFF